MIRVRARTALAAAWGIGAVMIGLFGLAAGPAQAQDQPGYKAFDVAIYTRAYEVQKMSDPQWLQSHWDNISRNMHVDHIYLETHRDKLLVDAATIRAARKFFEARGVRVSGGITWTVNERNRFQTFCYNDPADRAWVKHVTEYTASLFDEIVLDDFFFTSCKSDEEIDAKGGQSWTEYRLKEMDEAARDLVVGPARAVNPKVRVIIKYPNWYEHFQGLGFDLKAEPGIYSAIYTGTETRDATMSAQHLQPYESYQVVRYYDNIAPGRNLGGWVDPGGMKTVDRYAQQLALTLFAKAPEITLFDFRQMSRPITLADRGAWQDQKPTYDFDAAVAGYRNPDGSLRSDLTITAPAGWTFRMLSPVIAQLGQPLAVASYRPYGCMGEDFLHNYIGGAGIPVDLRPSFPAEAHTILLTEDAQCDPDLVGEIKTQLRAGKTVVITSGLLRALQDRGLSDIAEQKVSDRKALVQQFTVGFDKLYPADKPMIIPEIDYLTNDSWDDAEAVEGEAGWPMLHEADYSTGHLFVVTVPDNFSNLYDLPAPVLDRIRRTVAQDMFVRLQGPGRVSLFAYDNQTLVAQSFRDEATPIGLVTDGRFKHLRDLQTGEVLTGTPAPDDRKGWAPSDAGKMVFAVTLKPQSFRAFRAEE